MNLRIPRKPVQGYNKIFDLFDKGRGLVSSMDPAHAWVKNA